MKNPLRGVLANIGVCLMMAFTLLIHNSGAKAQTLSDAQFNAVLSGMGGKNSEPDFDAVIAAMGSSTREMDFDAILSGMGSKNGKASATVDGVFAAMNVTGTLNYLDNIFSFSDNGASPLITHYGALHGGNNGRYSIVSGNAVLPVYGRVTSNFGFRPSFGRMHKGLDIAVQVGDTIVAAMDGRVERISFDPQGYGIFICVDHGNGFKTRYAHLSQTLVTQGRYVSAGEAIALGGNTGNSTGPHLHFETRVNDVAMDPSRFFDFNRPINMTRMRNLGGIDSMNPKYFTDNSSAGSSTAAAAISANMNVKGTYVVRAGDTVASVAKKNGISVNSLCRLNMISSSDVLQPGRMLKVR